MWIVLLGMGLLLLSGFMFYLSLFFLVNKISYYIQWEVLSVNTFSVEMVLVYDWMTLIFLSVVFVISSMVMFYSMGYMSGDNNKVRFYMMLIMFVVSMVFLICSPNMISILIGWDGLGLISYCLVIYYSSYTAYNYGMITFMCNRLGDVGILMLISLLMVSGSWNMLLMMESDVNLLSIMVLVLSSMTKSAQIPFSTWLPKAMAAPTPVSSLVHSSTLVTAGVYLLIRYSSLMSGTWVSSMLLCLSSLTMVMSGIAANLEGDLKKIIALSTLSQLGLMMSILSFGAPVLAFFHLLTHAMFKSLLFLSAGTIIHSFSNNQDIRLMGSAIKFMPFSILCFFCASLSLGGFPFLSGFYSKDLIMEFMFLGDMNLLSGGMLLMGTMATVSYSVRLMMFMIVGKGKFMPYYSIHNDYWMNFSMVVLLILSMMGGSFLANLYFDAEDLVFLSMFYKLIVIIICVGGVGFGIMIYYLNLRYLLILDFLSSLWFVDSAIKVIGMLVLNMSGLISEVDKVWLEKSSVSLFSLLGMYKFNVYSMDFSMFSLMKIFLLIIILLGMSIVI